jgi:type IV pilus assembly protein PilC
MAEFHYRARNRQGKVTKGVIKAATQERASAMLAEHGLIPLEVQDVKELSVFKREFSFRIVRVRDRAIMARQLATMIQAGIPILQALRILVPQTENPHLADIIREVSYDVEGGESLSNALEKFPRVFSEFFISMVRSGEASGRVADTLEQLADHEERDYEIIRKVRGALVYPAFVLTTMIVLSVVMMVFVIPQLIGLFEESGVPLPWTTRVLIAMSLFGASYWWFLLLFFGLAIYLFSSYARTPEGMYTMSAVMLRLPLAGNLLRKISLARFSGALKTLVESEVPVIRALLIARDILGNRVYQAIINQTAEEVKNGSTISAALEKYPEIPLMVSQMISVGERSGKLGGSLEAVHRFYRREVDDTLQNLSQLIEPVVIVLLGIGIAMLLSAVLLPIYRLVEVIA